MAVERERKAPGGRLPLLIALLALQVSATAAFARVLQGRVTALELVGAAAASLAIAVALERRSVFLAIGVSAAALLVVAGLMVFRDTTRLLLPTLDTLRAIRDAFGSVGQTAAVEPAPAAPLPPFVLAALTGVWAASFSGHALAARARSPFLALVPAAALIGFTSLVVQDGARPPYVIPFLGSALAVLFADGLWRVGQWGPITMWHGKSRFGVRTSTRGARRVGLVCLAIALFAPGLLPGFRSPGLYDLQGKDIPSRVSLNPIVDIRFQLISNPDVQVFTVQTSPTSPPTYWRIMADDVFNGRQWLPAAPPGSEGPPLGPGRVSLPAPSVPDGVTTTTVAQRFRFDRFYQPQLPVAFQPTELNVASEPIRYDLSTGVLFDQQGTHPGFTYDVLSTIVQPTPQQLDEALPASGPMLKAETQLPRIPAPIVRLAHDLTDNQPTVYRKVLAIQNYFRQFEYSLNVPPGHGINEMLRFLEIRKGYCEQFAGTMAVMLRALGIPARVAVGYTRGTAVGDTGLWQVNARDAHAWVEVLFPRYGWLAFEPTPGNWSGVSSYDFPPASFISVGGVNLGNADQCVGLSRVGRNGFVLGDPCQSGVTNSGKGTGQGGGLNPPSRTRPFNPSAGVRGGGTADSRAPWLWILIALASLVGLLLLLVPAVKLGRRRLGVIRARDATGRVLAAYQVLAGQAGDVGLGRLPAETMWEYRSRLKQRVATLDGDLDRLTGLATTAAYGHGDLTRSEADQAMRSARSASHAIRRSAGPLRRVTGWFRVELSSRR